MLQYSRVVTFHFIKNGRATTPSEDMPGEDMPGQNIRIQGFQKRTLNDTRRIITNHELSYFPRVSIPTSFLYSVRKTQLKSKLFMQKQGILVPK